LFASEVSAENGEMRSKEEILKIAEGFAKSGMTRREYCAKHGVTMTTLVYCIHHMNTQRPDEERVSLMSEG
jgi:hypothetical protein